MRLTWYMFIALILGQFGRSTHLTASEQVVDHATGNEKAASQLFESQLKNSDAIVRGSIVNFEAATSSKENLFGFSWFDVEVESHFGFLKSIYAENKIFKAKKNSNLMLRVGLASPSLGSIPELPLKKNEEVLLFLKLRGGEWILENHLLDVYGLKQDEPYRLTPKMLEMKYKKQQKVGLLREEWTSLVVKNELKYHPSAIFSDPKDTIHFKGLADGKVSENLAKLILGSFKVDEHIAKNKANKAPGVVIAANINSSEVGQSGRFIASDAAPNSIPAERSLSSETAKESDTLSIYFLLGLLGILSVFGNVFVRFFFPEKD